jgi:hypothetical protein
MFQLIQRSTLQKVIPLGESNFPFSFTGVNNKRIPKHIGPQHFHFPFGRLVPFADLGAAALKINVLLTFKVQAAKQPATGSGDFGRIQKKLLFFGHLNGHRLKFAHKEMAAANAAAIAYPAENLGFMPDPDLPELNPGSMLGNQYLDQFTKINPGRSCEVEDDLALIKSDLYIHQFHVQSQLADLPPAIGQGLLAQVFILDMDLKILGTGQALNSFDFFHRQPRGWFLLNNSNMSQSGAFVRGDQYPVLDPGLCRLVLG